jgi:WXG100 protein secretion system (Wss), protein YukD
MLAATVLVTVRGPSRTVDLELPGDVPVGELVPILLEICGAEEDASQEGRQAPPGLWVAGTPGPLSSDTTLVDAGVYNGAVLGLQTDGYQPPLGDELAARQHVPRSVEPGVNTGGIGVTWEALR